MGCTYSSRQDEPALRSVQMASQGAWLPWGAGPGGPGPCCRSCFPAEPADLANRGSEQPRGLVGVGCSVGPLDLQVLAPKERVWASQKDRAPGQTRAWSCQIGQSQFPAAGGVDPAANPGASAALSPCPWFGMGRVQPAGGSGSGPSSLLVAHPPTCRWALELVCVGGFLLSPWD